MTKIHNYSEQQRDYKKLTKKKSFSQHLAYHLYYLKDANDPTHKLVKGYRNSIYCATTLRPNGEGKLTSHYCKNRWCPVCQSIRIAKLINGYAPVLKAMNDLYFVTLTAPTVQENELDNRISEFRDTWRLITNQRYWKRNKPKGIRKAECTVRPFGFYHYHFHVIIEGRLNAEWLLSQWLQRFPQSSEKAQDIRKVDETNGGFLELFKYFTKLVAQDKATGKRYIDFERLDIIFQHLQGSRVYQPFGGISMVKEDFEDTDLEAQLETSDLLRTWQWITNIGYVSEDGEILTNEYQLPRWIENLCGKVDPNNTPK